MDTSKTKPQWMSKTLIGAAAAIIAAALEIAGFSIPVEQIIPGLDQAVDAYYGGEFTLNNAVVILGGVFAWYGRVVATKEIKGVIRS